jgi:hypothetical protein
MLLKLLGAPVTAPLAGFKFIVEQLQAMAERELDSVENIRDELLLLQLQLDEGEITEEEYQPREDEIIARLHAARERQLQRTRPAAEDGETDH